MKCKLCRQDHEDVQSVALLSKIYFLCHGCAKWLQNLLEDTK